ncbi:GAF sensor hybrid histidine kinase [Peribacillus asahii]|uniref:Circadian input-output histidine kinase CikA n=1 Tax=Peribacillus asahii TaxID=228899 RepID=A0A3T0KX15_9BACI|nr:ATP-binding protein [Peribacillus asahii]AZV44886.1 GAF sensor hybrid histidine kinase [Peribacillus asahii]
MRLTISKKLIIGFLSVSLFSGGTIGIIFYYINKADSSYAKIENQQITILNNVKSIQVLSYQQTNSLRGYLLTGNSEFKENLKNENNEMTHLIDETHKLTIESESEADIIKLGELNQEFQTRYEELLSIFEEDVDQEQASDYFVNKLYPIGNGLSLLTTSLAERQQIMMDVAREEYSKKERQMKHMLIIFSVLAVLLNMIIGLIISRNLTKNLSKITNVIKKMTENSSNEIEIPKIEVNSRDEVEDIATAFNKMTYSIKEKSWLETSIVEMATMYQGIHDLKTLGQRFMNKITSMIDANYGVFYVKQGTGEERFHSIASYAFNGQNSGQSSFGYGEGIVGQAALEKRTIYLTDLPEDYIKITSGVGSASPANLMVIPVEYEGEVIVVIELAKFKEFTSIQQTLINQVANQIGVTVKSVSGRMQIENLLKESKDLTEELQSQSEELQLHHNELVCMNEKLEEQARQLELTSNYKSEFLANMSHELRSPLNSLLVLANLIAENTEGNLTEQQVVFADTIYKSGNDLLQLINEVLDLSKIESGKIDIIPSEVLLKNICLFAERQFLPLAKQKGLHLSIQLDENLPETIRTDQYRLQQIIRNLLSNAIKFTAKGVVTLHVHQVHVENMNTTIAFSIKDTGIGIPKEKQKLIFRAFQQGDGTTSRKYGGTGLGLSISQDLASLLGGNIKVESDLGKGSIFTLYLPICETSNIKEAAFAIEVIDGNERKTVALDQEDTLFIGKKILVIDDDMRNIFAITSALENKQMEIVFAQNGKDGMSVLKENSDVDLILMDIMMPEMDGYETIYAIREMPGYKKLPIIALTAKAMAHDKEKCIEAGASDYISKPVYIDQLLSLMRVWLYK